MTQQPCFRNLSSDILAHVWNAVCTRLFSTELCVTAKDLKQPKCSSTEGWLNKLKLCVYKGYYEPLKKKKEWGSFLCTDVEKLPQSIVQWKKQSAMRGK